MKQTDKFGTAPLGKLLREQAIPASIGILTMSIYGIVDTIFVGRVVGPYAIGAITVVLPITFLIASIGMAIGVGGASVLSRAIGDQKREKAFLTFGNQVILTLLFSLLFVGLGYFFRCEIIYLFGGHGEVHEPAVDYFKIILIGIPFLAWSMMSNNVIRAEGYPRVAMIVMIIPAIINLVLDPLFILVFEWGLAGAAWATTLSYIAAALFTIYHFKSKRSQMPLNGKYCKLNLGISKEILGLGTVTLARQGVISILATVLNNSLYTYGGEMALSAYGIISRVMMFAYFPILGITQGFIPIVGYNFGARNEKRVRGIVRLSIFSASFFALIIFAVLMIFASDISSVFTKDQRLVDETAPAFRTVFLATPLLAVSLIISAYYQAIGKAWPALILALTKQGFFLIPLVLILPIFYGINGIWMAFPIADIGAALASYLYYKFTKTKYPSGESYSNPDLMEAQ